MKVNRLLSREILEARLSEAKKSVSELRSHSEARDLLELRHDSEQRLELTADLALEDANALCVVLWIGKSSPIKIIPLEKVSSLHSQEFACQFSGFQES